MGKLIKRLSARLVSSPAFGMLFLATCITGGAVTAGIAAYEVHAGATLAVVAIAGIAANRFAFRTLEMDLFFGLCVINGAVGQLLSPWFIAVPGGALGLYFFIAVSNLSNHVESQLDKSVQTIDELSTGEDSTGES
jgi:hypothetical protein